MKKILAWSAIVIGTVLVAGFLAFLYFIPPFTSAPPEVFIKPEAEAAPSLDHVADPVRRALAERGKYIVTHSGCAGCHTPGGVSGLNWNKYLAGGTKFAWKGYGTVVSRNLTPDPETGLGTRTDHEIKRVLRSGVLKDGRVMHPFMMPWAQWSNWSEEDRHAVVVYLRNLKPVKHRIPDAIPKSDQEYQTAYALDYAIHDEKK